MPTAIALTERIGSEIRDLDLGRETPDEDIAYVVQTLAERGVVVIRNQKLTIDQFMGFSRRVGPLAIHSLNQFSKPGFPELMVNSNIVENGKPLGLADAGRDWHTDGAYTETPYRSTILYSVEIPVENGKALGDTVFASTSAAYDALGPELRQKVDSLKAVHAHGVARDKRGNAHALEYEQSREMRKGVEHPVVMTHPVTGRKCLYVDEGTTREISGLAPAQSEALLKRLVEHVIQEKFQYRHNWRVGDILMWDNCSTLHQALGDYKLPLRRLIYRTLVKGTRPQ